MEKPPHSWIVSFKKQRYHTMEALDGLGDFKVGGQIIQNVKYVNG